MSKGLVHLILLFFIVFQLTVVSLAASDMEFVNVGSPFINLEQIDKQKLANVSAILEDQKGFIWLVNESGLLRFDGKQFKLFPELAQFSSPEVEFLGEGANGQIWIVTHDSKLASFDTINSKLTFHSLYQFEALNNEGAELIEINGLDIKGETLYLFTKNRILMINEQRFSLIKEVVVPIAENDNLIRIAVTDAGEIWASSFHGSGPMLFDGTDWQFFTHDKKDKTTISAELVLKIFEDSQKRVWFGTYSGLDLYLPESKQFKRYPPRDLNAEENKNLGIIGNLV